MRPAVDSHAASADRRALAAWLDLRGGDAGGTLFVPVGKSGRMAARGLSDRAVLYVLRKRGEVRERFAEKLLHLGGDGCVPRPEVQGGNRTAIQKHKSSVGQDY